MLSNHDVKLKSIIKDYSSESNNNLYCVRFSGEQSIIDACKNIDIDPSKFTFDIRKACSIGMGSYSGDGGSGSGGYPYLWGVLPSETEKFVDDNIKRLKNNASDGFFKNILNSLFRYEPKTVCVHLSLIEFSSSFTDKPTVNITKIIAKLTFPTKDGQKYAYDQNSVRGVFLDEVQNNPAQAVSYFLKNFVTCVESESKQENKSTNQKNPSSSSSSSLFTSTNSSSSHSSSSSTSSKSQTTKTNTLSPS